MLPKPDNKGKNKKKKKLKSWKKKKDKLPRLKRKISLSNDFAAAQTKKTSSKQFHTLCALFFANTTAAIRVTFFGYVKENYAFFAQRRG